MPCDNYKPLLMGYLDKELAGPEIALVEEHLEQCNDCTTELESFRRLKEVTADMRVVLPDDRHWEEYWSHVYNRLERRVGWILISLGTILLLGYALSSVVLRVLRDLPLIVRIGLVLLIVGLCTLLVSVIRERLFLAKSDKYKGIKR